MINHLLTAYVALFSSRPLNWEVSRAKPVTSGGLFLMIIMMIILPIRMTRVSSYLQAPIYIVWSSPCTTTQITKRDTAEQSANDEPVPICANHRKSRKRTKPENWKKNYISSSKHRSDTPLGRSGGRSGLGGNNKIKLFLSDLLALEETTEWKYSIFCVT